MRNFIIAITVLGIIAVIGPIVVGTMSFEGTVVDNPYERGLDWDKERALIVSSGLSVLLVNTNLLTGPNELLINVTSSSGIIYNGPVLLRLTRPESSEYDAALQPVPAGAGPGSGRYTAVADIPMQGKWLLKIELVSIGNRLTFTRELHARPH